MWNVLSPFHTLDWIVRTNGWHCRPSRPNQSQRIENKTLQVQKENEVYSLLKPNIGPLVFTSKTIKRQHSYDENKIFINRTNLGLMFDKEPTVCVKLENRNWLVDPDEVYTELDCSQSLHFLS